MRSKPNSRVEAPNSAVSFQASALCGLRSAALAFGVLWGVFVVYPADGVQSLLVASIVGTVLAVLAGLFAATAPAGRCGDGAADDEKLEKIKDARWSLAEDEARYRNLLDSQDDLIERRNAEGGLVFVNHAYGRAFGVRCEELLGTRFHPPVLAAERQLAPFGERPRLVELIDTANGPRWISWEEQRVEGFESGFESQRIGRDVTDDRRTAAELGEARDAAESANRAKSRFLASMSHEIRTPMNGILGMTSLLAETELTELQRTYARAVDESARALLSLIDEILDFSKIEAGRLDLAAEAFSLRASLSRAIDLLAPKAEAKGLWLTWSIEPDLPDALIGDKTRVRQIVLNLLSNAIKFTDAGAVAVRVFGIGAQGGAHGPLRVGIEVADTGVGFTAEAMRRLFDEFDRGDAESARRIGGAGLGLAISRRLARAMGGDVTAEGAPGIGAVFKVVLRLSMADQNAGFSSLKPESARLPEESRQPVPIAGGRHIGALRKLRVLIAEDNAINALLARHVVERINGEAVVVGDGAAAVAAVAASITGGGPIFDLILMDMFMPVMDGLEASRAIVALFAESGDGSEATAPIIALTANAYPEDRARCLAAGMSDYLAKPFDSAQLQQLAAKWLHGAQDARAKRS